MIMDGVVVGSKMRGRGGDLFNAENILLHRYTTRPREQKHRNKLFYKH
jgi:hypothetical protein